MAVGLDAGGISVERSAEGSIQAGIHRVKADLRASKGKSERSRHDTLLELMSLLSASGSQVWLTLGDIPSSGGVEQALDLRYLPNRSKRVSVVMAVLTFQLDQAVSHHLQYFVDDLNAWLEKVLSTSSDTSGENLRLIGSRYLAQDDLSLDTDSIDSESTVEEGMHVECVILKGKPSEVWHLYLDLICHMQRLSVYGPRTES